MAQLERVEDEQLRQELLGTPEVSTAVKPTESFVNKVEDPALRNELLNISAETNTPEAVETVTTPPQRVPNYLERISSLREKRISEVTETFEKLASDEIGLMSGALQTVGKGGFGAFLDFTGETVTTGLSAVVPDFIEDPFKDAMVQLFSAVGDTEVVKEAKTEWDKLDSNTKKNVESAANVLTVLVPKLKLTKAGTKVKNTGEAIRKARISDSVKLPNTTSNKIKEAQRGFRDPVGHKQMVDELAKVKGFKPTNSAEKNLLLVGKEISKTEGQLQNLLRTLPKQVKPDELYPVINRNLKELLDEQTWIMSDKAIENSLKNNLKAVNKIIDKYPKTTEGLLKARREVDKLFNKSNKLAQPANELTAKDAITKVLRNSVNEVIDTKYPSGKFKGLLSKEHQLLKARDNLAFRYGNETTNVQQLMNFAKQHPIASGLTAQGSGMVVGLLTNPYITAASAVGGTAFLGYRALPNLLKGVGNAIEMGSKVPAGVPLTRSALFFGNEEQQEEQQ